MFVLWENKEILLLNIKDISMINSSDTSIKVELENTCNNIIKNYIDNWFKSYDKKSMILSWNNNNKKHFYIFNKGFPNIVNIDNQGRLSSFKFKFENFINITRKYKINCLLLK